MRRADPISIDDAFRLTGFFLTRHVYEPRGMSEPDARGGFLAALRKLNGASAPGEDAA
jgi:DNA repair protein RecO (recombination protein O)